MNPFKIFLFLLLLASTFGDCPSKCSCKPSSMQCYGTTLNSVYETNSVVTEITYTDSVVDLRTVLKAYPNVYTLTFVNSKVQNCHLAGKVRIVGACYGQDNVNPIAGHNTDTNGYFQDDISICEQTVIGLTTSIGAFTALLLTYILRKLYKQLKKNNSCTCFASESEDTAVTTTDSSCQAPTVSYSNIETQTDFPLESVESVQNPRPVYHGKKQAPKPDTISPQSGAKKKNISSQNIPSTGTSSGGGRNISTVTTKVSSPVGIDERHLESPNVSADSVEVDNHAQHLTRTPTLSTQESRCSCAASLLTDRSVSNSSQPKPGYISTPRLSSKESEDGDSDNSCIRDLDNIRARYSKSVLKRTEHLSGTEENDLHSTRSGLRHTDEQDLLVFVNRSSTPVRSGSNQHAFPPSTSTNSCSATASSTTPTARPPDLSRITPSTSGQLGSYIPPKLRIIAPDMSYYTEDDYYKTGNTSDYGTQCMEETSCVHSTDVLKHQRSVHFADDTRKNLDQDLRKLEARISDLTQLADNKLSNSCMSFENKYRDNRDQYAHRTKYWLKSDALMSVKSEQE